MINSITLDLPKFVSLEAFNEVWGYESQEIDDHANFQNPDSLLNKFNNSYHNAGRAFGDISEPGKATFFQDNENLKTILGTLGVVTGTSGLIFSGLMAAVAFDGMDAYQVVKNADTTEKLLQYSEQDVSLINWDICIKLINNIETWIFPKISVRIKSLTEIISMSSEATIANDRLALYLKALDELKVALDTLKSWVAFYESEWNSNEEAYLLYEKGIKDEYELEKKKLKLVSDSLLIDKAEYVTRQRDIEDKYRIFRCNSGFGLVNQCDHVHVDGSAYCFYHKCHRSDCNEASKKDMHFCEEHIKHVSDLKNETVNSTSMLGAASSTKIFLYILIPLLTLFAAGAFGVFSPPVAPEVLAPEVETPTIETPEVEAPPFETPTIETPAIAPPKIEAPSVVTPE